VPTVAWTRTPPKFCTSCGAPWDPSWTDCPHCVSKGPSGAAGAPRPRYGGARRGSLGSAISLYFSLLGVSAITVILVLWGDVSEVSAEIFGTVGLTLVVLFWMVADSRRVLPALARWARRGCIRSASALAA
jgi:hypothetical protein